MQHRIILLKLLIIYFSIYPYLQSPIYVFDLIYYDEIYKLHTNL